MTIAGASPMCSERWIAERAVRMPRSRSASETGNCAPRVLAGQ